VSSSAIARTTSAGTKARGDAAAPGEDHRVRGVLAAAALRHALGRGDDAHHADRKHGHDRRSQRRGHEHAVAVPTFEQRLHGSPIMAEAVEQTRAGIEQQVRRHLGRGIVDRLLRGRSPVDPLEQQRAELREDHELGQEELGLRSRQEADEVVDAAGRASEGAGEPPLLLLDGPGHAAGLRIARPHDRLADGDSIDCR